MICLKGKLSLSELKEISRKYFKKRSYERPIIKLSTKPDFVDKTLIKAEKLIIKLKAAIS